jgi:hypothetical protein
MSAINGHVVERENAMSSKTDSGRILLPVLLLAAVGVSLAVLAGAATTGEPQPDELSPELRTALAAPIQAKVENLRKDKNSDGVPFKRATFSKNFKKVDDQTYTTALHVDTAGDTVLTTERYELTLKPDAAKPKAWTIAEQQLKDTFEGLRRGKGEPKYFNFDRLTYDAEGLKLTATKGSLYQYFRWDRGLGAEGLYGFTIAADDLAYDYTPPTGPNFDAPYYKDVHSIVKSSDRTRPDVVFKPQSIRVSCNPRTCESLVGKMFEGLRPASAGEVNAKLKALADKAVEDFKKRRQDSAFADFWIGYNPDDRYYRIAVHKDEDESVSLRYYNHGGFELEFSVWTTDPLFRGLLYGYYTEETNQKVPPYELELRDDDEGPSRFYDMYRLKGTVECALDDPEKISGDVEFGLLTKQDDVREIEFVIATIRAGEDEQQRKPSLTVNSIQLDGKELTWVRTGPYQGLMVLPEPVPAGTRLNVRMDFDARVIEKINHAYSAMLRGGWLPFVRFGDMVDEFELTVKVPSQYKALGIGKKVHESTQDGVTTTRWVADSSVEFPSIIFGKYAEDSPTIKAKKLDGTEIPVTVHVDEVSMGVLKDARLVDEDTVGTSGDVDAFIEQIDQIQDMESGARGIRGKQLRPIGEQAVNSINLYTELSGIDYPYGELNLVNDPAPALYGQAPSSLIYLGSWVFRGEGTMAGGGTLTSEFAGGGGTRIAKFLKSVVAHEVGHQWWGSRVVNANSRNYWFVESLAEYFSALYLEAAHGPKEYQEQLKEWRKRVLDYQQLTSVQNASVTWGGENPFAAYQAAVYNKGPYAFHILRMTFGDEKFFPFLKRFTQRLVEKGSIVTRDIQIAAEEGLGGVDPDGKPYKVNLEWFFDQWIRGIGIPEYRLVYTVQPTEDGGAIVEGTVQQRVVAGQRHDKTVLQGTYYRGVVPLTVVGKKGEYQKKLVVESAETPFRFKVPERPLDVALNKYGEILAHDVVVNKSW